jgi:hypothetical protein
MCVFILHTIVLFKVSYNRRVPNQGRIGPCGSNIGSRARLMVDKGGSPEYFVGSSPVRKGVE